MESESMQHWLEPITMAYLDPGTGSYALQLLMAGLFGGMFALRQSWGELRAWASSRLGANRVDDGPPQVPRPIGVRFPEVAEVSRHARTSPGTK
jgi:hypothetical protein